MDDKVIQTGRGKMSLESALTYFDMELHRPATIKNPRRTDVLISILRGLSEKSRLHGEQAARMFFRDRTMYPERFSPAERQSMTCVARYAFYQQDDGFVRLCDIAYQEIGTRTPVELPYLYADVRERMNIAGIRFQRKKESLLYDPREETFLVHIDDIDLFLEAYRKIMTRPALRERR